MTRKGITRVAAYGLLEQDNKILLCRLSERVGINAGSWTLPGGGLDFGEDPKDAVVREFMEETGLVVSVAELVTIDSMSDHLPGWSPMHSIRIIYRVNYISGELRPEQEESTDLCAWHTQRETQDLPLVSLARHGVELTFA